MACARIPTGDKDQKARSCPPRCEDPTAGGATWAGPSTQARRPAARVRRRSGRAARLRSASASYGGSCQWDGASRPLLFGLNRRGAIGCDRLDIGEPLYALHCLICVRNACACLFVYINIFRLAFVGYAKLLCVLLCNSD